MELLLYFAAAVTAEGPVSYRVLSYLLLREAGRVSTSGSRSSLSTDLSNFWSESVSLLLSQQAQLASMAHVQAQLQSVVLGDGQAKPGLDDRIEELRLAILKCCGDEAPCAGLDEQVTQLLEESSEQTKLLKSQATEGVAHDAIARAIAELNDLLAGLTAEHREPLEQRLGEIQELLEVQTGGATHAALRDQLVELQDAVKALTDKSRPDAVHERLSAIYELLEKLSIDSGEEAGLARQLESMKKDLTDCIRELFEQHESPEEPDPTPKRRKKRQG